MNHFFWLIIAFVFSFGLGQPGNNPGKKTVKGKALFQNGITIEIEDVDHFKDSIVFKGRPAQKTIVKTRRIE